MLDKITVNVLVYEMGFLKLFKTVLTLVNNEAWCWTR